MNVGDILVWVTARAKGHDQRRKYHLYIGDAGWREDGHAFLFINSANYGGDYKIVRGNYTFLSREVSFIGCNGLVVYPEDELRGYQIVKCGELQSQDAHGLHDALAESETMEAWQISLCCDAIRPLIP